MRSLIAAHTKYSVSLLWVCAVDAHASPLATENHFSVHWTNVFIAAKIIPSISILCAAERKAMVPLRMNMRFCSLLALHTCCKEKGTQTAGLFTLQSFLRELQAISARLDLAMKKERKMAAKTVLFASKRKQNILHFMKCEKSTDTSCGASKL